MLVPAARSEGQMQPLANMVEIKDKTAKHRPGAPRSGAWGKVTC
jgi:hypothetical protein